MKILAIDTTSTACSVALLDDEDIFSSHEIAPQQQAKIILPRIETLLSSRDVALADLDAIAFGCGPGSFTGVRIGISVAQGLGFAVDLPLIPVSSLAAMAQSTYDALGWQKMIACIDARIQEVYYGVYEVQNNLVKLVGAEKVSAPSNVKFPDGDEWCGVGNAWEIYSLPFKPVKIATDRLPMATGILSLAREKFLRNEMVAAADALPVYLRDEVAGRV